ncbi:hypothetical protein [Stygiolobus caldivivus]|uniref:Uncharacterized protein n=1 Tax=Stygiolobus caldivivus TaxID=2824673 RepID=A0A8D5U4U5_9CREN|nr:hypothetical protein [Stygiolobus caldivivus]BCU69282.1 hypothetical protein KN1_05790 [Stygiolobus caldivivus]
MKCSTESVKDIRGFNFLISDCNKEFFTSKFEEFRKLSNESGKTYIIRLAESNYFRFEVLMISNGPTLLSISTSRGTNNITLRDFTLLEELGKLSCCAYNNQQLKELFDKFLSSQTSNESEVVDLMDKREEVDVKEECQGITQKELKLPEQSEGKWSSTELLSTERLVLKALAGQVKFLTISTERPQNSIKFTSFERLKSLCCFINLVLAKLDQCPSLKESLDPLLHQDSSGKRKRKR